jgi:Flp pilus assembly protein TadG
MTAMVFPALLALTLMIIQAGLYYHYKQRAAAAAEQGAAAAAALAGTDGAREAAGQAAAGNFLTAVPLGEDVAAPAVNVEVGLDQVTVTVEGEFNPVVPIGTSTITASATAPLEQFVPETER